MDTDTVVYRDVPGFPGYRVGDDGSLWCCRSRNGKGGSGAWRRKKANLNPQNGRYQYELQLNGRGVSRRRATLVALAFIGPQPPGQQVRHLDGDCTNDILANLAYGTPKQNAADMERHGRRSRGERHGASKLTDEAVREIRRLRRAGVRLHVIAARFHIHESHVCDIARRKKWRHVSDGE